MLLDCPECNNKVSSDAASCPHCGKPVVRKAPSGGSPPSSVGSLLDPKKNLRSLRNLCIIVLAFGGIGLLLWRFLLPAPARESTGKIFDAAVGKPVTLAEETIDVYPGEYKWVSFPLRSPLNVIVDVQVKNGMAVNVYAMDEANKKEFDKGGKSHYAQELSSQSVRSWQKSHVLPAGNWNIVVQSTGKAPLLGKGTPSSVYYKVALQR